MATGKIHSSISHRFGNQAGYAGNLKWMTKRYANTYTVILVYFSILKSSCLIEHFNLNRRHYYEWVKC